LPGFVIPKKNKTLITGERIKPDNQNIIVGIENPVNLLIQKIPVQTGVGYDAL